MKRICFLVDSIFSIGGVQRVTAVIAKALAKDYDVTIMTFDAPEKKDATLYSMEGRGLSFSFISYPRTGWLKNKICKAYSWLYLKTEPQSTWASNLYSRSSFPSPLRKAVVKELSAGHFDTVIGVHAPLAARLATLKKELKGVRCIGWIHNSFDALFGPSSAYIGQKRLHHYMTQFQKLDNLVVLHKNDADRYQKEDNRLRPDVIYNPLTLQPGKPSTGTSKRFLTVGRFTHRHKGIDLLIDAFQRFAEKDKEWCLDIVGEGVEEDLYRTAIKAYDLGNRITIHPFTKQIQEYYSAAQVYVLSSRWEGMPLVLVEAMSHGLPVVTSDLPVCKEIMGDFGLYFENGNVEQLAQRMLEATEMDWKRKSDEAFAIASRFDLERITNQWKAIL